MHACVHVCIELFLQSRLRELVNFCFFFSDAVEGPPLVPGSGEIIEVDNLIK